MNCFEMHANYFQNAEVLKGHDYSELLRAGCKRENKSFPSYWYYKCMVLSSSEEEKSGLQVTIVLC